MATATPSEISEKHREAARIRGPLAVPLDRFAAAVEAALGSGVESVADIQTGDLYLALACLAGDARAIGLFEAEILKAVRPSVERACRDGDASPDDVMQWTREKLLVGSSEDEPKLRQYLGKGALVGWVRVVAVREALMDRRKSRRERARDDAALLDGGPPALSMELTVLRDRYAASFQVAVKEALRRLSAEQRSLLRFHTHDGLTIDQLAPMLGIHRATVARRLERARADALDHTREILRVEHGLSESEAKSLCLVLAREVDISIGRALSSGAA